MRTNIEIDDELMQKALAGNKGKTKRKVVENALKLLIHTNGQNGLRSLKGIVEWEGDLHEMRLSRFPDSWDVKD